MIVRPETMADHEAVRRLLTDAFGGPAEATLVDLLRARGDHLPELALVAEGADGIAALIDPEMLVEVQAVAYLQ